MAACSPSDLLNANPFVGLSAGQKLAAECELVRQWAGSSETVSQILARAWDFKNLSEGTALAVEAGLLAEIAGESNPYVLLQNNGFVSLDSGLVWSAKLARLQELAGHSGDIDSLFLNNHFESIDQGLAMSAKLRLLCDLAYGTGSGSATQALTANAFWVMGEGLTKACINELLCLSSSSATIETIVTQSSVTPSETLSVSGGYDSVRVWTGETPVTEPWFFLYVTRSGVTSKIKMNRFEARVVNVPGGSIGFGTSDGRTIYVAKDVKDSALGTSFPVSGTANADRAGVPIWTPSAPHITLPAGERQYELVGSGTERIVFVSEYDGTTWSPARWLRLPASGSVRLHATFGQIALANYDGATVSVNGPTGTVIGGTSASASLTFPSVTGTTRNVTSVAELKTAIGAAVAGDEIVLASGTYALDVNITAASFTANNGVGGRIGAEGILIRGATTDRTLYVISCAANGQGDWNLNQSGATLRTGFKDLTFTFGGSNTAAFTTTRGRFSVQNCRFTGTIGASLDCFNGIGSTTTNGLYLDCYQVQADTSIADCWNFNDGNTTANRVRLIDCIGHTSGAASSDQCVTTHNGLPISLYGGHYYNSHTNVMANGGPGIVPTTHCFFVRVSRSARQGTTTNVSAYGCRLEQPATSIIGWVASLYSVATYAELGTREASNNNAAYEGNLFNNAGAIGSYYAYFPNVSTTTTFERNVCTAFSIGIRMDNGAGPGVMSANRNSLIANTLGCSKTTTWTSTLLGNVSKDSVNQGMSITATGMANTVANYNVWDPPADADYVNGANDVSAEAGLDASYLPTAAGNCDGTGDPAGMDWVGGTDYVGFLLEISSVTRDRGARCRPRIISNAELTPDIW